MDKRIRRPRSVKDIMGRIEFRPGHCERHGAFEDKRFPLVPMWLGCPVCREQATAEHEAFLKERAAAARQARWQKRLGDSGVPVRFRDRTFENYRADLPGQQRALAFARAYADDFENVRSTGRCALFLGAVGTGKSHLAAAICMQIMQTGATVRYVTALRAVQAVADTYRPGSQVSTKEATALLTDPDLLVLDEVGMQADTEHEQRVLSDALNKRYEDRKPTLVLSNLNARGVRDYLGPRLFDRLREGGGEFVRFDWEGHRGRA